MQTQTIIHAHQKAIKVLQLIDRANTYIKSSEKYAQSTSTSLQPVIEFHKSNVVRYTRIADRLQDTYINLKCKIQQAHINIECADMTLPF